MFKFNFLKNGLLLAAVLVVLRSSSCKKDDDPTPAKTKTQLLTQANWKLVKAEIRSSPTAAWSDYTAFLSACEKDNLTVFRANLTYENNEGATKCNPTDPQIVDSGTWAFLNNETQIQVTPAADPPETLNLELLDENTLIVNGVDNSTGSTLYTRATFGH